MPLPGDLTITIQKFRLPLEHHPIFFQVEVLKQGKVAWVEPCPTEEQLSMFIRGVKAGCAVCGVFVSHPGIPVETEELPSQEAAFSSR